MPRIKRATSVNYYDLPYVSQSMMKAYMVCPYYGQRLYIDKNYSISTPRMELGKALDMYITEPEAFGSSYRVVLRRSKEMIMLGKARDGKIELTQAEYSKLNSMREYFYTQPVTMMFDGWNKQKEIHEKIEGVQCKSKLDFFKYEEDGTIKIADLKLTGDASWERFKWVVHEYNYLFQLAFYGMMAARQAEVLGLPTNGKIEFYIIAMDETPKLMVYQFGMALVESKFEVIKTILHDKPWDRRVEECTCNSFGTCPFYRCKEPVQIYENHLVTL